MRLYYGEQPVVIKDGNKYEIEMHYLWLKWAFSGLGKYLLYPANDCFVTRKQINEEEDDEYEAWTGIAETVHKLVLDNITKVRPGAALPPKNWFHATENHIIIYRNLVEMYVREKIREAIKDFNTKNPNKNPLPDTAEHFFTYGVNISNGNALAVIRRNLVESASKIRKGGGQLSLLSCPVQITPDTHKLMDILPLLEWVKQDFTEKEIGLVPLIYKQLI